MFQLSKVGENRTPCDERCCVWLNSFILFRLFSLSLCVDACFLLEFDTPHQEVINIFATYYAIRLHISDLLTQEKSHDLSHLHLTGGSKKII